MRKYFQLALAVLALGAAPADSALAQSDAIFLATYVEVMPNALASAADVLRRYREASRHDDGNLRFEVLGEIDRPNRFLIIEAWKDKAALDNHAQSAGTLQFREQIKPIQDAPNDQRVARTLHSEQGATADRADAIHVVTHVDVVPPSTDTCLAALKAMSVDTPSDPGNISYQVLQQTNRANHFTVIEEWTDRQALDAHAMAAHTRAFRETLIPIAGALYDERLYRTLN